MRLRARPVRTKRPFTFYIKRREMRLTCDDACLVRERRLANPALCVINKSWVGKIRRLQKVVYALHRNMNLRLHALAAKRAIYLSVHEFGHLFQSEERAYLLISIF